MQNYTYFLPVLAYQVNKRHKFLNRLFFVKDEERTSYENINTCVILVTICVCVFSALEVATYFFYLTKVRILEVWPLTFN